MPGAIGVLNFMGVYRSHSIASAKVMTAERKPDFDAKQRSVLKGQFISIHLCPHKLGMTELMTIHSAIPPL